MTFQVLEFSRKKSMTFQEAWQPCTTAGGQKHTQTHTVLTSFSGKSKVKSRVRLYYVRSKA